MTAELKFNILNIQSLSDTEEMVSWESILQDGPKYSKGGGSTQVLKPFSTLSEAEQVVKLRDTLGEHFLETYIEYHTTTLAKPILADLIDDWYIAYQFYCQKTGATPVPKATAYTEITQGKTDYPVAYSHSIYNITLNRVWSHTFGYNYNGHLYHVKIKDGVVSEWYTNYTDLVYKGKNITWTGEDLETGNHIEYYTEGLYEPDSRYSVSTKYDYNTDEVLTTTLHAIQLPIPLPEDYIQDLNAQGFSYLNSVIGFAQKSYGKIVEYVIV